MAMDAQQRKDLESAIALARKKELPFGICLGKKPEGTVWKCLKSKSPEVNGKFAKKEGETGKFTFGVMTVQSKDIHLIVHGKMISGMVKKLKEFLKSGNIKMKIRVFDLEGNALESDGDALPDEEVSAAPSGTPAPAPEDTKAPDPLQAKWQKTATQVEGAINKVKGTTGLDLAETIDLWAVAAQQAESAEYAQALETAKQVVARLKAAVAEAKSHSRAEDARAKKWQDAARKLAPLVQQTLDSGFGDTAKINGVWMLAQSKAAATPPNYAVALKAAGALVQLLAQAKKAAAKAPQLAPEPQLAGDAPTAPPAPEPPMPSGVGLSGIEAQIIAVEAQITRYKAIISDGAEPVPPKWLAALQACKSVIAPMKVDAGKLDVGKLGTVDKMLSALAKTITSAAGKKAEWKAALALFKLGLAPLDHHPQAAAPEVKPAIDALKSGMAKAEAKATAHNHSQAIAVLQALHPRCAAVEALADDFAAWKVLDTPRKALAQTYAGKVSSIPAITALMRKLEATYVAATADATAGKYKDAVAKLDLIPPLFTKIVYDFKQEDKYNKQIANYTPRIAAIKAKSAEIRTPIQSVINEIDTRITAADVATTGSYKKSMDILADLWRTLRFVEAEVKAIESWITALKAFDLKLAAFQAHAGASGVQESILEMKRDRVSAMAEAAATKHSTAKAVLERSKKDWPRITARLAESAAYKAARKMAQEKIEALAGREGAATMLAQASALLDMAAAQAVAKNFTAAKTSAESAAARADAADAAAKAQAEVAALQDTDKLDGLSESWPSAFQVYTNMRDAVAAKDTDNTFAPLLLAADAVAEQGHQAHINGAYPDARSFLDTAISDVQKALVLSLSHGPYTAHKATVSAEIASLLPLNVDNAIKPQIDAATALLAAADALVQAPKYEYPAAEQKLIEASKTATRATADAALYTAIKADRAIIANIQTAINANNVAKTAMPKRLAMLQKMLTDIDALVAAGKFGEAGKKAKIGAAMRVAILKDIGMAQACITKRANWYDAKLPLMTGPGKAAGAKAYAKVQAKLAVFTGYMSDELFMPATNTAKELGWAVNDCIKVIAEAAAFAPVKARADAALSPLKASPSAGIAAPLEAQVTRYSKAMAEVAKDNYFTAQKLMATIPDACKDLPAINAAYKAYAPVQKAALEKLEALKGHDHADAVAAMVTRLQGKYDNALTYAQKDDYATAQRMMSQIPAAAADAITTADRHGILEKVNDFIGGDEDSAPWWPQIEAAKLAIKLVSRREHAEVAQAKTDAAYAHIAVAEQGGQGAKPALKAALEACNTADAVISQYQFHLQELDDARSLVAALGGHAQTAYIAGDIAQMNTALEAAAHKAASGTDVAGVSAEIEAVMASYHTAISVADSYGRYLILRAEDDVEPRLGQLEAHPHRYAIKASIDTLRAHLQKAAEAVGAHRPDAAIKLLELARALGVSAFVTAEMMANTPPDEADLEKIINGPGGTDALDAIVENLPPEAQRAVLKVAFKVRFGCSIENFNTANRQIPVPDGSAKGPNIMAFYKAMADLPVADTLENDSMRKFEVMDANGSGSSYSGTKKRVLMSEGNAAYANTRYLASPSEVNITDPNCKPANDDPVNYFNWNTLHEVGHAVDDKHGFMDKNAGKAAYAGWQEFKRDVKPVALKIREKYKYDLNYIISYMAGNNSPAIPEKPATDPCSAEEWEARRLAVCDHIDTAKSTNKPWQSMSLASKLAINGVVYQESYPQRWYAYNLDARSQGITAYQFRAPGEWFSELYAAYHSEKLKPSHPAASWLAAL